MTLRAGGHTNLGWQRNETERRREREREKERERERES